MERISVIPTAISSASAVMPRQKSCHEWPRRRIFSLSKKTQRPDSRPIDALADGKIGETAMSGLRATSFAEVWTEAQHLRGRYLRLLFSRGLWSVRKGFATRVWAADGIPDEVGRARLSQQITSSRLMVPQIRERKGRDKIVALTAYSAPMAAILDPLVDLILVGDTLGMVLHGLPTTVGVTLDMMILHGRAVMRGSSHALVVVDLPFGSYERSAQQAHESAVKVMQETGCQAVKVEASDGVPETIEFLVRRGIPVLGHVGLRPQASYVDGGFKAKGRSPAERDRVLTEAKSVDRAGAFALIIEGVAADLADEVTREVSIPTIGIGASPSCDGQILVTDDMIGLFDWTPKFVRRYGAMRELVTEAVRAYAADVRSGAFPDSTEMYTFKSKGSSA
jgi:3-methyl-2-oxobutanoate hydroxymethyltransferase